MHVIGDYISFPVVVLFGLPFLPAITQAQTISGLSVEPAMVQQGQPCTKAVWLIMSRVEAV